MNNIDILTLSFPSFTIKIIQQKRKKPTVICTPKIENNDTCITTQAEIIIKDVIYNFWCPISKKFYNHQKKSLGHFYFKILKSTFIKNSKFWGHSFNSCCWINYYPEGVGLSVNEELFQMVYLPNGSSYVNFLSVDHSEIAKYYKVSTENIEQILTKSDEA